MTSARLADAAVARRREAVTTLEFASEMGWALEADVNGDVAGAGAGGQEQRAGALEADLA
jgi:hypothetical protein